LRQPGKSTIASVQADERQILEQCDPKIEAVLFRSKPLVSCRVALRNVDAAMAFNVLLSWIEDFVAFCAQLGGRGVEGREVELWSDLIGPAKYTPISRPFRNWSCSAFKPR
jgi:hypothetical protein